MSIAIERATPVDADAIEELLRASGLPLDGVRDHLPTALVARSAGRVVGSAALEVYGDGALLRSVVVSPSLRGTGLGQELTRRAIDMASALGVPAVYLLTTTAEGFFPRFKFASIDRDAVPRGVRQSIEFRSACPASAIVMRRWLP